MREDAVSALLKLGVPNEVLSDFPGLPGDVEALLVYGSQARGDAVPGSDLDVLALVASARATSYSGLVSVSYYTIQQLESGIGTLFGSHLRRDARIAWDKHGKLSRVVASMGEVDTDRLFSRAREMSTLFTNLDYDLPKYLPGLLRQARYLLRSCLYAQSIDAGRPCFSVRELAIRHNDVNLVQLLASRQKGDATVADLTACLSWLRRLIGGFPLSENGSLEATVVNEWGRPSDTLSMAFMALGATGNGSDYAEVEKILL
ncbi:nucleotidyltransferase domain-containing protein [Micromonospora fiedleri]|uniref:Nucleotidyltransferase domain-containing protein n=1 Tax=Micromonospora fiedleri TaxID=1157498 RepID=A0ABS1UGE8_9ACTN|nr:nucleotidyltransferase domain-containing protein [Micromonospora fiedleri]MBL6275411.1 nucleotidyltransferase domain-containing protein [Micromonospora fiedleri]